MADMLVSPEEEQFEFELEFPSLLYFPDFDCCCCGFPVLEFFGDDARQVRLMSEVVSVVVG